MPDTLKAEGVELPPSLAHMKAGAAEAIVQAEIEREAGQETARANNWTALLAAVAEDLGPDLFRAACKERPEGWSGWTSDVQVEIRFIGHAPLRARYCLTHEGEWKRTMFGGVAVAVIDQPGKSPWWRVCREDGDTYTHGLGPALHYAELSSEDIEAAAENIPF